MQVLPIVQICEGGVGCRVPNRGKGQVTGRRMRQGVLSYLRGKDYRPDSGMPRGLERCTTSDLLAFRYALSAAFHSTTSVSISLIALLVACVTIPILPNKCKTIYLCFLILSKFFTTSLLFSENSIQIVRKCFSENVECLSLSHQLHKHLP